MNEKKTSFYARELLREEMGAVRRGRRGDRAVIGVLSVAWALFQLALPRLIILDSITVRAVHLSFAIALVFLCIPSRKSGSSRRTGRRHSTASRHEAGQRHSPGSRPSAAAVSGTIPWYDYILAALAAAAVLYIVLDWTGIAMRSGLPIFRDIVIGIAVIILVLEAARRVIGPPLVIIALLFTAYAFLGPRMPSIFAFRGVTLSKYLSQVVLSTEGIYGIPLDVSANTVFLFVLLGSMLHRAGAGRFFNALAISLLGRFKGGPAKAAVVSSGLTGLVSGSSIANVVTTGTFTIPLMKKVGYPGRIAAATEVAASTNGQLMPPIMGAAAFIIAEYLGKPYLDVVKAAAIPAFVSYIALFYITHLEASRLNMRGLDRADLPRFGAVFREGFYYLIPLLVLLYELMIMRHTPKLAAFNAIVFLMIIVLIKELWIALKKGRGPGSGLRQAVRTIGRGLTAGSRNMLTVALATATAGIVVGIVTMGIGSMVVQIVEYLSGGNIFLLLLIAAMASLILGMGLPTTATYIVMASITVPVIVKLGAQGSLFVIPAMAAHLFCFYFGILADDTPPVGLAAYAAAAIARSDPIRTGIKGFVYDLRTGLIPFMFVFNPELILHGIDSWPRALLIFAMATLGACAFANAVQGWCLVKNRWYEAPLFLAASVIFFYPAVLTRIFHLDHGLRYYMYLAGAVVYGLAYAGQRWRAKRSGAEIRGSREQSLP